MFTLSTKEIFNRDKICVGCLCWYVHTSNICPKTIKICLMLKTIFSPWTSVKPFFVKLSKIFFNAVKHNYKRRKIYLKWSWTSWSLPEHTIHKNRVNIVTFWTYLLSRIIIGKFTQPLYDNHIKCRIYRCVLLKLWNFSSGKCDQWLIIQSLISGPTHLFHGWVSPGSM